MIGRRIECGMLGEFFGFDVEVPECRGCACCGTSESESSPAEPDDAGAIRAKTDRRSRLIMLELIRGSDQDLAEEAGRLAAELRQPGLS